MFEQDYIMREVQKLTQVLSAILGLKKEKKFDEALDKIDNTYLQFFDENAEIIQSMNIEGLKKLCTKDGQFLPNLAFALADLLTEEAEIMEELGETTEASKKYAKALSLYRYAVKEKDATIPINAVSKMEMLQQKIEDQNT